MALPRRHLGSFLEDLQERGDGPAFALRTAYRRFTWSGAEPARAAREVAARLTGAGCAPGDRVLLLGPSSPEWVASLLGILAAGTIAVPLDEGAPDELVRAVASKVRVSGLIAPAARAAFTVARPGAVLHLASVADFAASGEATLSVPQASPQDTAEIVFTSGTTAEPKGVELSHENLLFGLSIIEREFLVRRAWLRPLLPLRLLCLVPLSHLFGQVVGAFVPIVLRSTGVFTPGLQPGRVLETIRRERPAIVAAVPRMLSGLSDAVRRDLGRRGLAERFEKRLERAAATSWPLRALLGRDVRRSLGWRTWGFVVGGAALDPEVEEFWRRCGLFVIQGYGMTEAAPIIAVHNPLDGATRTIGRPLPGLRTLIAPDGELLVSGPNVMKGYYEDPDATRRVLQGGWLRTGDLVTEDGTGRLTFKGRSKDSIVTADGMNVHPSDVEGALGEQPEVSEAVAFSLPGPLGEEVHAAVLVAAGGSAPVDPEALRRAANLRLAAHQRLRSVTVWREPDFPRTPATGKVRRRDVAAAVAAVRAEDASAPRGEGRGEAGAAGGRSPGLPRPDGVHRSPVASAIAQLRAQGAQAARQLRPDTRLIEDLGLGSLEMVELVGLLEEEHGARLDDRLIGASMTVGGLDRLLTEADTAAARIAMPRWTRRVAVRWARTIVRPLLLAPPYRSIVRLEVCGRARLRGLRGPFLIVSNHQSLLDVPTVFRALPGPLRRRTAPAMAIETLPDHFEPLGKPLHRRLRSALLYNLAVFLFGAYPLPQSRGYRPSLEYTGELIDRGFSPLIFPEGERTPHGEILPFKTGIGLLAVETRVPVLPVLLEGLYAILPRTASRPKPGRARVVVGEPFDPLEGDPAGPVEAARRIEAAVRRLAQGS